jgi:hypothetical protein
MRPAHLQVTGGAAHLQVTGGADCTSHRSISSDSQVLSSHSRGSRIQYFGCSTYAPTHPSVTSFYSEVWLHKSLAHAVQILIFLLFSFPEIMVAQVL